MNRRQFFSFAAVAPVAATSAAFMPATAAPEFVVGIDMASATDALSVSYLRSAPAGWDRLWVAEREFERVASAANEGSAAALRRLPALGDAMRKYAADLYRRQGDGTLESTSDTLS